MALGSHDPEGTVKKLGSVNKVHVLSFLPSASHPPALTDLQGAAERRLASRSSLRNRYNPSGRALELAFVLTFGMAPWR